MKKTEKAFWLNAFIAVACFVVFLVFMFADSFFGVTTVLGISTKTGITTTLCLAVIFASIASLSMALQWYRKARGIDWMYD